MSAILTKVDEQLPRLFPFIKDDLDAALLKTTQDQLTTADLTEDTALNETEFQQESLLRILLRPQKTARQLGYLKLFDCAGHHIFENLSTQDGETVKAIILENIYRSQGGFYELLSYLLAAQKHIDQYCDDWIKLCPGLNGEYPVLVAMSKPNQPIASIRPFSIFLSSDQQLPYYHFQAAVFLLQSKGQVTDVAAPNQYWPL
ncbi:hypothetical protein MKQ70_32320 [Chitinophaga sedimenti]|uniref:hypothetical protein n=1 Tax=Chitinophaga sedimenti TaxID=2033606 RepID=UPI00200540C5|nr:hypothetical protein [Chitinophaga sedimenti]MCK7559403.1 hypothetical protein [Chitinophaga sedimenti]